MLFKTCFVSLVVYYERFFLRKSILSRKYDSYLFFIGGGGGVGAGGDNDADL